MTRPSAIPLLLGLAGLSGTAVAQVFVVNSASDPGLGTCTVAQCTLRDAITDANNSPFADQIVFAIPGGGPHVITLGAALPALAGSITVDGYTQAGATANTLPDGDDASLQIVLDGSALPSGVCGLSLTGSGSVVRGLVVDGFAANFSVGVCVQGTGGHTVAGNFVGIDAAGFAAAPNYDGVSLDSDGNTVGGTDPADRNVISGNQVRGLIFDSGTGNVARGNFIGTDRNGTAAIGNGEGIHAFAISPSNTIGGAVAGARNVISGNLFGGATISSATNIIQANVFGADVTGAHAVANGFDGLFVNGGDGNLIGGSAAGAGNLISGNGASGIVIAGAQGNLVVGNRIGTDGSATAALGNAHHGIVLLGGVARDTVDNEIGGTFAGAGNVIAFNGQNGISITDAGTVRNAIHQNSIYRNGILGIDLGADGATSNDAGDVDLGPNQLQNFPLIRSVVFGATTIEIVGAFRGAPNAAITLEFFANPCNFRPRSFLEGQSYLGTASVNTDGAGFAAFDVTLPAAVTEGSPISATATDASGNTSELAQQIVFSIFPPSGPGAGGTGVTISGTNFDPGVTVTIGGAAPANVVRVNDSQITAESPALPPGSLNDVVVTNPDTTTGTLLKGWVADFLDVPDTHQFHPFVTTLVSNGVTVGCGFGDYCVDSPTTRQQMAVFLLKALLGFCFTPPPATGTVFADVPASNIFAPWIEELQRRGLTAGCGGGNYCPDASVTRAQMAVFLLNTAYGPGYVPPPATGTVFDDVPAGSFAADWIEDLVARGITAGCSANPPLYCPTNPITRGQMATFIVITFALQP
jgi:hypothetical protein